MDYSLRSRSRFGPLSLPVMSADHKIEPHRVTKPIQLLAAWLVGLILVDAGFLAAALKITEPGWAAGWLVLAAIVNVPLFLLAIFLLQTRFRPEMQEDTYYAKYLETKTGLSNPEPTATAVDTLRHEISEANQTILRLVEDVRQLAAITSGLAKQDPSRSADGTSSELMRIHERVESLRSEVEGDSTALRWSNKKISVNKTLDIFPTIVRLLSQHGIPVHETFGTEGYTPHRFVVALGDGFSLTEIGELVSALRPLGDGLVMYADDDDRPNQYDNNVLIGAYGKPSGIPLKDAPDLAQSENMTAEQFYTIIGRGGSKRG